ncbi:hypothetical protein [Candidatus Avelusimicrobium stercoris]|uniref:hypothetical protein n=1 Tax=Candidatus Avelusimicrobium stercoris TaxID=1947924 RepID=UPI003D0CA858
MVETIQIKTPIKCYGQNFITKRCAFTGDVQNMSALYDNAADTTATFYNTDVTQPKNWHVAFKDKYGIDTGINDQNLRALVAFKEVCE